MKTALIQIDKVSEKERKISLTLDGAVRLLELSEELPEGDSDAILHELFKDTGVTYRGGSIFNIIRVNWKSSNEEYNFFKFIYIYSRKIKIIFVIKYTTFIVI